MCDSFLGRLAMRFGFFARLIEGFEKFSLGEVPAVVAKKIGLCTFEVCGIGELRFCLFLQFL